MTTILENASGVRITEEDKRHGHHLARVFNVRDQKNTFGPAFRAALAAAPEAKP